MPPNSRKEKVKKSVLFCLVVACKSRISVVMVLGMWLVSNSECAPGFWFNYLWRPSPLLLYNIYKLVLLLPPITPYCTTHVLPTLCTHLLHTHGMENGSYLWNCDTIKLGQVRSGAKIFKLLIEMPTADNSTEYWFFFITVFEITWWYLWCQIVYIIYDKGGKMHLSDLKTKERGIFLEIKEYMQKYLYIIYSTF